LVLGGAARGVFVVGWGVGLGSTAAPGFSLATAESREEQLSSGLSLIVNAAFIFLGPKVLQRVNTKVITGQQANDDFLSIRGGKGEPPWEGSLHVTETTLFTPAKYVRVYTEGATNPKGAWVMAASEIEGLSAIQIQQKFALPFTPSKIVTADLPASTTVRIGTAGKNAFGPGGGLQVHIQQPR
jgi:hypothetical protein